jgi:hypothetical protein
MESIITYLYITISRQGIKEGAGKRPRPGSIGIGRIYFPAPA